MRRRCCNLDWLEIYVLEPITQPRDYHFFIEQGWKVDVRPYGTRSYRQMFTLLDAETEEPFLEVRREPVGVFKNGDKSFLPPNGCHLRLTNRYCYYDNAANLMAEFIARYGYEFQRIAKVDVALDFVRFDSGDYPQRFLARYIAGAYSKINQSNIAARGRDEFHGRQWTSCSWGSEKSPVLTRFYNKSKELAEVKDKPYIRQAWALCGLVDDVVTMRKFVDGEWVEPDVWRVEFSVRSGVRDWVKIDNELTRKTHTTKKFSIRNDLSCYATRPMILRTFASLALHYFHFKHYREGMSKYKSEDKQLFDFEGEVQEFYSVDKVATSRSKSMVVERLLHALEHFILVSFDQKARKAAAELADDLRRIQLEQMAVRPWDTTEVSLLRHLISLRVSNPTLSYDDAHDMAETMVSLSASLFADVDDDMADAATASMLEVYDAQVSDEDAKSAAQKAVQ